jgi:iron-sulfur cluster protein
MSGSRRAKAERIRTLLETEGDSVAENTRVFNEARQEATENFDRYEDLRSEARAIKEDAIERLPELIERVQTSVEANGGTVHLADDAEEAREIVREIADDEDAETVVKSKSMTTEEVELEHALGDAGLDVYETDLGEFVVQLADEAPSHIIAPGIHKSREEIAELFETVFDPEAPPETAEELTAFARDVLGEYIREADIGVTGANFVLAESGSITLVTNEGNARKTAVTPDTHVAVAGIEKLLPSVERLGPFVELIAKSATGQDIAQYVSVLTPPVETPTLDFDSPDAENFGNGDDGGGSSDRDFHLVLLDNGRREMREDDDLRETLYCIRCGACSNACGNFQSVGGHAFGGETYSGGIATGWEAGVEGEDTAAEFEELCTGCSRCVNACPVKIDIPWINTVVRDRINRSGDTDRFDFLVDGLTPDAEEAGIDPARRLFGNAETLAEWGSRTAPLSNWLARRGSVQSILERTVGVTSERNLPEFRRKTLVGWFRTRGPQVRESVADRTAVLYPDVFTNHVGVERGKAAVRLLEALGVRVEVPPEAATGSGRAPLSQGMIETAREKAEATSAALASEIDAGRDVVVVEPSALAMLRHDYHRLLPDGEYDTLAAESYEILEYAYGLLADGTPISSLDTAAEDGTTVPYHPHCQARTLGIDEYTEATLERAGYIVETAETECCGMAGSFGYKSSYYELSVDVGEPLRDEFGEEPLVFASGTSCLDQLEHLCESATYHPVELLAPGTDPSM